MTGRPTQADVSLGVLGAALTAAAAAFAAWGIPPIPPALSVLAGIPSPLTGMTRSFVATMRGDVFAAFALHPLGPLCVAACVVAMASLAVFALRGRRPAVVEALLRPRFALAVAALFAAAWIRQIVVFS